MCYVNSDAPRVYNNAYIASALFCFFNISVDRAHFIISTFALEWKKSYSA